MIPARTTPCLMHHLFLVVPLLPPDSTWLDHPSCPRFAHRLATHRMSPFPCRHSRCQDFRSAGPDTPHSAPTEASSHLRRSQPRPASVKDVRSRARGSGIFEFPLFPFSSLGTTSGYQSSSVIGHHALVPCLVCLLLPLPPLTSFQISGPLFDHLAMLPLPVFRLTRLPVLNLKWMRLTAMASGVTLTVLPCLALSSFFAFTPLWHSDELLYSR